MALANGGLGFGTGFNRVIYFGKESTFGDKTSVSSSQILRRAAMDIQPGIDPITSNEIRDDYQRVEFRNGTRRVSGPVNVELGVLNQSLLIGSLLRRDFTTNSAVTLTNATISSGVATVTTNPISAGFKVGDVVRLGGTGVPAALVAKNCRITALTTTTITSPDFTADGGGASMTITKAGSTTYTPVSGHTADSYSFEVWERGLDKSTLYSGVRIGSAALEVAPNAITTMSFETIGKDFEIIEESGGSSTDVPYFSGASAAGTGTLLAGPQGVLRIGTSDLAIVTGATINIDNNITADPVIGATTVPEVFYGGQVVNGQFTMYVKDMQMLKDFSNESELSFQIVMEAPSFGTAPGFVSVFLPRIKLSGFNNPDANGPLVQTVQFEALKKQTPESSEYDSQIVIQEAGQAA